MKKPESCSVVMEGIPLKTEEEGGRIIFNTGADEHNEQHAVLTFLPDGRIYVRDRLAETDKQVVAGVRLFLQNCKYNRDSDGGITLQKSPEV